MLTSISTPPGQTVSSYLHLIPFRRVSLYVLYLSVLVGAYFVSQRGDFPHGQLYFYTFLLGFITAFTEILGKFRDEPIKALETIQGVFYHVFNGAIAALSLYFLFIFREPPLASPIPQAEAVKLVLLAGFGSMLVMRSKLFTATIDGEEIAVGPEQVIKVFFHFMEKAIDRVRAQARMDFIRLTMDNINCAKVHEYCLAMIKSAQTISAEDHSKLKEEIDKILENDPCDPQLKSYRLGFLLLDHMGESFVHKLFDKPSTEWQIQAPGIKPQGPLAWFFSSRKEMVHYFAYGNFMSIQNSVSI